VRIFSREQYGLFRQAFVVIGTSYTMLGMAVGVSAFYYLPRKSDGRAQIVLNILSFNLATGTAGFLVHPVPRTSDPPAGRGPTGSLRLDDRHGDPADRVLHVPGTDRHGVAGREEFDHLHRVR
jgi:hypothetical protein